MTFAPKPTYRTWNRAEQVGLALDEPFTFSQALGENFAQGMMDSFGLGTFLREVTTPPLLDEVARRGERPEDYAARRERFAANAISKETYEASPSFRKEVPWERGMTEERAAALAAFVDRRKVREHFSQKQPIAAFLGQMGGQALDPVNYIPVFGQASHTAAVAKFGSIGGRLMIGASEAAVNTAAFGVFTAGLRGKMGDDVSFAAITNEIAMSALIGGVFGTGIGLLARGGDVRKRMAEAKLRDGLERIDTLQRAQIPLGEAATRLAQDGEVRLSANSQTIIERMRAEVSQRDVTGRALETETAGVTKSKPGEVVISPSGFKVEVRPEVVELDSLIPAAGALQVRNRNSKASAIQVEEIATKLDPARLMPNVSADQGAPLVGGDNIVDSGNGRVMAIRRAYEAYPDKAEAYRQALVDAGYQVEGMRNPVLVQRRVTPLSADARAQFNADANTPSTARMSAVELADMDRAALTDSVLGELDDAPIAAASNRPAVARFLANLPPNERGALVDEAGNLSADGVRRLENALVASAYGDVDAGVLRRFAEAVDDNTRAIVGAMSDVAGRWAKMRRAVRSGELDPEFDMTVELTDALRMLGDWRDQAAREKRPVGVVIKEGMAQMDLLGGELSPEGQIFVRMFYKTDTFTAATGREALAARLNRVMDATFDLGKPQLFGADANPSKTGVLKNALADDIEADFFAPDGVERGVETFGQGGERPPAQADSAGNRSAAEAGRPDTVAERVKTAADMVASQPARTLDELYEVAPGHQKTLGEVGSELGAKYGAEWKDPGIKKKETSAEKMARKRYDSTRRLTDVVRGGYVVKDPGQVDSIIADLAKRFKVVDEGWRITAAGYFDRKAMVQFDDGTIGEVQFWHPDMLSTKEGKGHDLYEEMRKLPDGDPKYLDLLDQQREIYLATLDKVGDEWLPIVSQLADELAAMSGRATPGKAASNSASVSGVPESMTSSNRTASQPPPSETIAQAELPDMMAGRPSQSKNVSMPANVGLGEAGRNTGPTRTIEGKQVTFDDEIQADLDQLGRDLLAENGVTADDALAGIFPRGIRLGRFEGEARRLLESIGEYLDPPARNPGDLARAAMQLGAGTLDEIKGPMSAKRVASFIDPGRQYEWLTARLDDARRSSPPFIEPEQLPLDMMDPPPDPPPAGLVEAEARVGKGEDLRALAEQFGVDEAGNFVEQGDIDRLRAQGRLTPEDEAAIKAADDDFELASSYADTLNEIAATCGVRG